MRSWTEVGSAAEPETRTRARPKASARPGSDAASRAIRPYMVGTPNTIVAPRVSAPARAWAENRPTCSSEPPRRSGPSMPMIRPCTWNTGSACATRSSAVHRQISASASRLEVIARRGIWTPLGGPVVPDVYITNATSSSPSSSGRVVPAAAPAARSTSSRASPASSGGGSMPAQASSCSGALSSTMCPSSREPSPGLMGTMPTPAASAPTTATHSSRVGSAHTATRPVPSSRAATRGRRGGQLRRRSWTRPRCGSPPVHRGRSTAEIESRSSHFARYTL